MTENLQGWVVAGAIAVLAPSMLLAQDAGGSPNIGTSTPPELRDFRLDTPPPRPTPEQNPPQPSPEVAPKTTAPATQPTVSERNTPIEAPTRPTDRSAAPRQNETPPSEVRPTVTAEPVTGDAPTVSTYPVIPPEIAGSDNAQATTPIEEKAAPLKIVWLGAAIAALCALVAAALLFRRRKNRARRPREVAIPLQQPSPPARLDKPKPLASTPLPPNAPTKLATPPGPEQIFAEFKPEAAQLSIASLSVTGKLTIINRGQFPIDNLLMRSHMISAQNGQQEAIAAFHEAKGDGSLQSLGPLAAGERIDAVIEIRQLRTELSTFRWTEREFVAPIILINLAGQIEDAPVEVRLSHLIGRESDGTTVRMKPLPIDRGPKRFTGVSARPLFA
ncbi:MAG: hypothetical protein WA793_09980 [Sphingorhabdus sp.]|uniref:hypothetical protein n=1 Tax=Sphingorhabdus sp. TaxID=1902408 RepID=UPI003C96D3A6